MHISSSATLTAIKSWITKTLRLGDQAWFLFMFSQTAISPSPCYAEWKKTSRMSVFGNRQRLGIWGLCKWNSYKPYNSHTIQLQLTKGDVCVLSHFSLVWLFATLWTVAHLVPLSMEFPKQEYWNGLPCPPPGDLPVPGIKPTSLKSPAFARKFFTTSITWEAQSGSASYSIVSNSLQPHGL